MTPQLPLFATFHSFKGGVGRTMALCNTGLQLAAWRRRTLIVDLDLEAPGLTVFLKSQIDPSCDGFLGAWGTLKTLVEGDPSEAAPAPDLGAFVRPLTVPEGLADLPHPANLDLMPAGPFFADKARYAELLRSLDLEGSYDRGTARAMARLFRAWVAAAGYEYVLLDSRTGLNPVVELCVGDLADAVVCLSGLNEQNLQGTRFFAEELAIADLPEQRKALVLTPVPPGEKELRKKRFERVQEVLADIFPSPWLELPYDPRLALLDEPMLVYEPEAPIAGQYRKIAHRVAAFAEDDAESLGRRMAETHPKSDGDLLLLLEPLRRLAPMERQVVVQALRAVTTQLPPVATGAWSSAEQAFELLHEVDPGDPICLNNWGTALSKKAMTKQGPEADRLFALAGDKYAGALRINPDKYEAFNNWGLALYYEAKTKQGPEAVRLFARAGEKFAEALRINPGSAAYNLARLAALRGQVDEAFRLLTVARTAGTLPAHAHLAADRDLDALHSDPRWAAFMSTL